MPQSLSAPHPPSMPSSSQVHSILWPNPSVKGTSCGKPQAAPYVER